MEPNAVPLHVPPHVPDLGLVPPGSAPSGRHLHVSAPAETQSDVSVLNGVASGHVTPPRTGSHMKVVGPIHSTIKKLQM